MTKDKDLIPLDVDLMRKLRKTNNEAYQRMIRVYKDWRAKQRTQDKREIRNQYLKIWRFKNPEKFKKIKLDYLNKIKEQKRLLRRKFLYRGYLFSTQKYVRLLYSIAVDIYGNSHLKFQNHSHCPKRKH